MYFHPTFIIPQTPENVNKAGIVPKTIRVRAGVEAERPYAAARSDTVGITNTVKGNAGVADLKIRSDLPHMPHVVKEAPANMATCPICEWPLIARSVPIRSFSPFADIRWAFAR